MPHISRFGTRSRRGRPPGLIAARAGLLHRAVFQAQRPAQNGASICAASRRRAGPTWSRRKSQQRHHRNQPHQRRSPRAPRDNRHRGKHSPVAAQEYADRLAHHHIGKTTPGAFARVQPPPKMNQRGLRCVIHRITGLPDLATQIQILAIHEVTRRKTAHFVKYFLLDKNARPRNHLDFRRIRVGRKRDAAVPHAFHSGNRRRRNSASITWLKIVGNSCTQEVWSVPSALSNLHPAAPARGIVSRHRSKGTNEFSRNSVSGFNSSRYCPAPVLDPKIIRPPKPDILLALHEHHPRKLRRHHLSASVMRPSIHHNNLILDARHPAPDRGNRPPDKLDRIPVDNDNGNQQCPPFRLRRRGYSRQFSELFTCSPLLAPKALPKSQPPNLQLAPILTPSLVFHLRNLLKVAAKKTAKKSRRRHHEDGFSFSRETHLKSINAGWYPVMLISPPVLDPVLPGAVRVSGETVMRQLQFSKAVSRPTQHIRLDLIERVPPRCFQQPADAFPAGVAVNLRRAAHVKRRVALGFGILPARRDTANSPSANPKLCVLVKVRKTIRKISCWRKGQVARPVSPDNPTCPRPTRQTRRKKLQ